MVMTRTNCFDIIQRGALALGLFIHVGCGDGTEDLEVPRDAPTTSYGSTSYGTTSYGSTSYGSTSTGTTWYGSTTSGSSSSGECPASGGECPDCPSPPPEDDSGTGGDSTSTGGDSTSTGGDSTSTGEPHSGSTGYHASSTGYTPPSGSTGYYSSTGYVPIEQGDPYALAARPHTQASGGTANCPGTTQLPANCSAVNGTSNNSARWLWCHRNAGGWPDGWLVCACADFTVSNNVNQAIIDQIESNCQGKPTPQEVLECVGELCDAAVGGTEAENEGVCRHHAACVDDVLDEMGLPHSFDESPTHLWNEAPVDTDGDGVNDATLIMDSYNGIYILCT